MDFYDIASLQAHISKTMAFYHPRAIDPEGASFITCVTMAKSIIAATAIWFPALATYLPMPATASTSSVQNI